MRRGGILGSTLRRPSPQEGGTLTGEDAGLIDPDHLHRHTAPGHGDARIAADAREIGPRIDLDPRPLEALEDPAPDPGAVLTDAAAEGDQIHPAELAHVGRHV